VPAVIQTVAQNAAACPKSKPGIQPEDQQGQQAIDLMFQIGCVFGKEDHIKDETNPWDGNRLYLRLSTLLDIKFPNDPNEKISLDAYKLIIKAINTTLKQKSAGAVVDGDPIGGLNQEAFITQHQWQTLVENRDSFIKTLETDLQNARKQSSETPTLPKGLTAAEVPDFLRFAESFLNQVNQGKTS
jgi:hypothetical protein